jgi:capsular polysaccharide biosynthesis protein
MDVFPVDLIELIGTNGSAPRSASGVVEVNELVASGSYRRQPPSLVLGELEPHAAIFRQFVRATTQETPSIRLVTLNAVWLLSQGALITSDGRLLRETCEPFIRDQVPMFGLEQMNGERFRRTAISTRHVEAPVLLVKGPWWRNYGHWMVDGAALLALTRRRSSLPADMKIVIGAYEDPRMRTLVKETIEKISPYYEVLEHPDDECWTFSRLYYVTPIHIPPLFKSPRALSDLREVLMPAMPPQSLQGRYYVQRPLTGRVVTNEPELIQLCRSFGLRIVRPEMMSLREQIELFRTAELFVGVKGAAFANLMFCSPGASTVLLSPADFSDAFYWDIAAQMKISYSEVFGPLASRGRRTAQNPFTIDLECLDRALRSATEGLRAASVTRSEIALKMILDQATTAEEAPNVPSWNEKTNNLPRLPLDSGARLPEPVFDAQLQSGGARGMVMQVIESLPPLTGANYLEVLRLFHQELRPLTYMEIGTLTGESLKSVGCPTIAIDAQFELEGNVVGRKQLCHFYQMRSDLFFKQYDPRAILGHQLDAAFLDGMHLCEFTLRDFANVERHSRQNSVVFIHDCLPLEFLICGRVHRQESVDPGRRGWWQGDVWRVILALKRRRPDLRITMLDAQPTGLACITNLNPASDVLFARYAEIVDEMHSWALEDIGLIEYQRMVDVESTSIVDTPEKMARRFWL